MKQRIALTAVFIIGLMSLGLSGCSEEKSATLTTEDTAKLRAAPGQPMPAEAKAMMEKGTQTGQEKAAGQTGGGAPVAPK